MKRLRPGQITTFIACTPTNWPRVDGFPPPETPRWVRVTFLPRVLCGHSNPRYIQTGYVGLHIRPFVALPKREIYFPLLDSRQSMFASALLTALKKQCFPYALCGLASKRETRGQPPLAASSRSLHSGRVGCRGREREGRAGRTGEAEPQTMLSVSSTG